MRAADVDKLKRDIVEFKTSFQSTNQDYMIGYISALSVVEGMIATLATLTLDDLRPKGQWVNNKDDYPECDQCGYMPQYDPMIDDIYCSPFCPSCGADMRGGIEDA